MNTGPGARTISGRPIPGCTRGSVGTSRPGPFTPDGESGWDERSLWKPLAFSGTVANAQNQRGRGESAGAGAVAPPRLEFRAGDIISPEDGHSSP